MANLDRSLYGNSSPSSILSYLQRVSRALNSQVTFGKTNANNTPTGPDAANISMWKATGTTPAGPNTEFAITHNLTWVPWFYFYFLDKAGSLYQGPATGTAWTAATSSALGSVFLKCSVASAAYTIIII